MTGLCDGGYFCSNRSISKTPGNLDEGGGPCQPGTYCPKGSPAPIQCRPGKICTAATLTNPDGDCFPGYYCTGGANVATPTDGVVGGRCPLGAYCPDGSKNYSRCPPGTYADTEGKARVINCLHVVFYVTHVRYSICNRLSIATLFGFLDFRTSCLLSAV